MFEALADALIHRGLQLDPDSQLGPALHFFVMDVAKIFALLVIVMQSFRPERRVEGYVWNIQMGQAELPAPDRSFAGRHHYDAASTRPPSVTSREFGQPATAVSAPGAARSPAPPRQS